MIKYGHRTVDGDDDYYDDGCIGGNAAAAGDYDDDVSMLAPVQDL